MPIKNIGANLRSEVVTAKKLEDHPYDCQCPYCLLSFLKLKLKLENKSLHPHEDNFLLYYLAFKNSKIKDSAGIFAHKKDLIIDWQKVLSSYYKIKGPERKIYFERDYPDKPEYNRIVLRYDKKFNISKISSAKADHDFFPDVRVAPFLVEMDRIFGIFPKSFNMPSIYAWPSESFDLLLKFFKWTILKSIKMVEFLKERKSTAIRDISIKFHFYRNNRAAIFFLLAYLKGKKIIAWDRKKGTVSLNDEWSFWIIRYCRWILSVYDDLKRLKSYQIIDIMKVWHGFRTKQVSKKCP